jgi:hypothetical protein
MDETTLVSNNNVFYNFLNTLYDIFLFLSIMGFSFVISMNIVSTLVYRPMLKWNDSKNIRDEDSEYNEKEYQYKYFEEFDEMSERKLSDEELGELKDKIINEETPRGEVILFYNKETDTFFYYCNSKEIPYQYLEAVSRHYVCIHDCKDIYIDPDKKKKLEDMGAGVGIANLSDDEIVPNNAVKESDTNSNSKSVFASFRNYNKENVKIDKNKVANVVEDKVNRYTYKGKLEDYDKERCDEEIVEVDFSSFKKMMQTNDGVIANRVVDNQRDKGVDFDDKKDSVIPNFDEGWKSDWWTWNKKTV